MVVNPVDVGLSVNDDVGLGHDKVVHVVIDLVDGGLSVNDNVGLALDHGHDKVSSCCQRPC